MNKKYSQLPTFKKVFKPILILAVISILYLLIKGFILPPTPNSVAYTDANLTVLGLNIPSNLHFCGEKIPANDFEIRHDLEKEFFSDNYWKNNSLILFHKAQRWFPYIEPILKEEGIPDDFKYLAVIESHLSNVRSKVGAAGFWQLVPSTAISMGLEVNDLVDERYDVEKATHAACKLLKQAHKVLKNWTLTAAAYNRGIGGILKAMKQQNTRNYYDLMLNPETGSFVYRILAYKTLFSSPGHFGIKKRKWNYYPKIQYKIVKIDSTVSNLQHVAKYLGVETETITQHNPWLIGNRLISDGTKIYVLKIPKKMSDYSGYLADLFPLGFSSTSVKDSNSIVVRADSAKYKLAVPTKSVSK